MDISVENVAIFIHEGAHSVSVCHTIIQSK